MKQTLASLNACLLLWLIKWKDALTFSFRYPLYNDILEECEWCIYSTVALPCQLTSILQMLLGRSITSRSTPCRLHVLHYKWVRHIITNVDCSLHLKVQKAWNHLLFSSSVSQRIHPSLEKAAHKNFSSISEHNVLNTSSRLLANFHMHFEEQLLYLDSELCSTHNWLTMMLYFARHANTVLRGKKVKHLLTAAHTDPAQQTPHKLRRRNFKCWHGN